MEFKIKLKPQIVQGKTIPQVKERIDNSHPNVLWSSSKYGFVLTDWNHTYFLVYNIVKINAKRVRVDHNAYRILEKPIVIAYVYKFTPQLLDLLGVKLEQGTRNFKLTKNR